MKDIEMIITILTMLIILIWFSFDLYLLSAIVPNLDKRNDGLSVFRANNLFARLSRANTYSYASMFPRIFERYYARRRGVSFDATERERILCLIHGYFLLVAMFCFLSLFIIDWLLDHQLYWW